MMQHIGNDYPHEILKLDIDPRNFVMTIESDLEKV